MLEPKNLVHRFAIAFATFEQGHADMAVEGFKKCWFHLRIG